MLTCFIPILSLSPGQELEVELGISGFYNRVLEQLRVKLHLWPLPSDILLKANSAVFEVSVHSDPSPSCWITKYRSMNCLPLNTNHHELKWCEEQVPIMAMTVKIPATSAAPVELNWKRQCYQWLDFSFKMVIRKLTSSLKHKEHFYSITLHPKSWQSCQRDSQRERSNRFLETLDDTISHIFLKYLQLIFLDFRRVGEKDQR